MEYLSNREDTITDFENNYKAELQKLDSDIKLIFDMYMRLLSIKAEACTKDKFEYLLLIFKSVEYLLSATLLVKQRANMEAGVIMRLCIETSSMAVHIKSNEKEFIKYKQNKYKSTSSISFTGRHIEGLGELWGVLSNLMVHPNTFHGITSELIGETIVESGNLNLGFKPKNEQQDKTMLLLLRIIANIIYKCFELILSKKANFKGVDGVYFEEFGLFSFGRSADKRIKEMLDELKNKSA